MRKNSSIDLWSDGLGVAVAFNRASISSKIYRPKFNSICRLMRALDCYGVGGIKPLVNATPLQIYLRYYLY